MSGQFRSRIHVLFRANQLREDDDEENDEGAAQPDEKVDGELLSPGKAHIFPFHAAHPFDCEIRQIESHKIDDGEPSFPAARHWNFVNLHHFFLVALFGHFLTSIEIAKHVAGIERRCACFGTRIQLLSFKVRSGFRFITISIAFSWYCIWRMKQTAS